MDRDLRGDALGRGAREGDVLRVGPLGRAARTHFDHGGFVRLEGNPEEAQEAVNEEDQALHVLNRLREEKEVVGEGQRMQLQGLQ